MTDRPAGRFHEGQRVRLSALGRLQFSSRFVRTGIVDRLHPLNREAIIVRQDGVIEPVVFHHTFWEPDEEEST